MIPVELHQSERGSLITIQARKDIPFAICRAYTIFAVPADAIRGCHAHRKERQFLVCLHGSCSILLDDGCYQQEYLLDSPREGLLIGTNVWRVLSGFSGDCVLNILSDSPYDPEDYIFDYDEFKKSATAGGE
ncbi:MAG: WxcM-like domain-containing protein [Coriobacteriaceae bacterium]|nr:WxcM-like domain-containing protein [Coriobacteriaceae bacterium]